MKKALTARRGVFYRILHFELLEIFGLTGIEAAKQSETHFGAIVES